MPIEASYLKDAPYPEVKCPKCGAFPLEPFMRGLVQRRPWGFTSKWPFVARRPYCAIICASCKEIVGYEAPSAEDIERYNRKRQAEQPKREPEVIYVNDNGLSQAVHEASINSCSAVDLAASSSAEIPRTGRYQWSSGMDPDDDYWKGSCP